MVTSLIAQIKALCEDADVIADLPIRAQPNPMLCRERSSTSELIADNSDSPPHFKFEVPWSKMPSEITRKLKNKERPTGRGRRELIRLIVGEILTTCPSPGKHLSEISRKIVSSYPQSFLDVIEDQVVGSGYDSLTNMRRGKNSLFLKRQTSSTNEGRR